MRIKVGIFIKLCVLLSWQYYYVTATPLIGPNVRNAEFNEFPFIVSLIDDHPSVQKTYMCTGSLITRKDVATSAHCVTNDDIKDLKIMYGSPYATLGHKLHIYWWISYEGWAFNKGIDLYYQINDVANIRLLQPVSVSVIPLAISTASNAQLYGKEVVIASWSYSNLTVFNPTLTTATVTALSNDECIQRIVYLTQEVFPMAEGHIICTMSNPHALLFYGDSGGPLLYNNELVGINKGICPLNVEATDPRLVNMHMSMETYKHFFDEVKNWFDF